MLPFWYCSFLGSVHPNDFQQLMVPVLVCLSLLLALIIVRRSRPQELHSKASNARQTLLLPPKQVSGQESLQGSAFHDNSAPLKISKYLKELTNNREKQAAQARSFSDFQRLADSSFRIACKVTRASPACGRSCYDRFSSSSSVCNRHIVPEVLRKLTTTHRPKKDQCTSSLISKAENLEEIDASQPLDRFNAKPSRDADGRLKTALQRVVLERKLFFESVFDEEIHQSGSWNSRLKHVDSLYLLRKRPVFDCLSNLSRDKKTLKRNYQWFDDNLEMCTKVSLNQRLKTYQTNAPSDGAIFSPEELSCCH